LWIDGGKEADNAFTMALAFIFDDGHGLACFFCTRFWVLFWDGRPGYQAAAERTGTGERLTWGDFLQRIPVKYKVRVWRRSTGPVAIRKNKAAGRERRFRMYIS
jgi:hypothetical protein